MNNIFLPFRRVSLRGVAGLATFPSLVSFHRNFGLSLGRLPSIFISITARMCYVSSLLLTLTTRSTCFFLQLSQPAQDIFILLVSVLVESLLLALSLTAWSWFLEIICSVALALRVDIVSPAATRRLQQTCICRVCASLRLSLCPEGESRGRK